jgi:hypothetical protein
MKDLFEKYLVESTWTGMGDEPGVSYPDDGSGIAGDDDRPPGNIILGPRFVRKDYFNKLTQYQTIWDYDGKEDFKWDYFENLSGQDDYNNYSDTLKSMEKLFPEDTWKDTWKKMRNVPDKEVIKRFDIAGQPWRSKDDQLGDHPEDQMGGTETADVPKELDVKESLNLTDRIDKLLIGTTGFMGEAKKSPAYMYGVEQARKNVPLQKALNSITGKIEPSGTRDGHDKAVIDIKAAYKDSGK